MMLHVKRMFLWRQFHVSSTATQTLSRQLEKVLDVIERLEYRPNAVARGLASKKTTTVGVIIPDISNIFYAELARGIEDIATMYRYNIILSNSDQREDKEVQLLDNMYGKQVDGIVLMSEQVTKELLDKMGHSLYPLFWQVQLTKHKKYHL